MPQEEFDYPLLDDELLIVRHYGVIPEVALHGSLYFLTSAPDGPELCLAEPEIRALKMMVVERYREIIARDLEPANRDKSLYRGLARAAVNWRRLEKFCRKEALAVDSLRRESGEKLLRFLEQEGKDVAAGRRLPSINCSAKVLGTLSADLGLGPTDLPPEWKTLCYHAGP
jgi:hypothetical protein